MLVPLIAVVAGIVCLCVWLASRARTPTVTAAPVDSKARATARPEPAVTIAPSSLATGTPSSLAADAPAPIDVDRKVGRVADAVEAATDPPALNLALISPVASVTPQAAQDIPQPAQPVAAPVPVATPSFPLPAATAPAPAPVAGTTQAGMYPSISVSEAMVFRLIKSSNWQYTGYLSADKRTWQGGNWNTHEAAVVDAAFQGDFRVVMSYTTAGNPGHTVHAMVCSPNANPSDFTQVNSSYYIPDAFVSNFVPSGAYSYTCPLHVWSYIADSGNGYGWDQISPAYYAYERAGSSVSVSFSASASGPWQTVAAGSVNSDDRVLCAIGETLGDGRNPTHIPVYATIIAP
jgi:hypothetical protein